MVNKEQKKVAISYELQRGVYRGNVDPIRHFKGVDIRHFYFYVCPSKSDLKKWPVNFILPAGGVLLRLHTELRGTQLMCERLGDCFFDASGEPFEYEPDLRLTGQLHLNASRLVGKSLNRLLSQERSFTVRVKVPKRNKRKSLSGGVYYSPRFENGNRGRLVNKTLTSEV